MSGNKLCKYRTSMFFNKYYQAFNFVDYIQRQKPSNWRIDLFKVCWRSGSTARTVPSIVDSGFPDLELSHIILHKGVIDFWLEIKGNTELMPFFLISFKKIF